MSVLFSKLLMAGSNLPLGSVYATVIGSNLGAFLTPIGALAGIMWCNLLKRNGIKVSFGRFMKYGAGIGIPAIGCSLGALMLIV